MPLKFGPVWPALPGGALLLMGLGAAAAPISFEDVTGQAGLMAPLAGFLGHGAAWGDFDRDGDPDLFVGGFADRPDEEYAPRAKPPTNVLFENTGDGKFRVVQDTPVATHARTSGAVFADLDNDGWPELIVGNNAKEKAPIDRGQIQAEATTRRTQLFRNVQGRFVDVSRESKVGPERLRTARNIMPLDFDQDGLLDLLVIEDRFIKNPRSALYRNRGKLRFEDVTAAAGLPEDLFGLGAAVGSFTAQGRLGVFVGHSNRFFLQQGDTFEEPESVKQTLSWKPLHNEDWPCGAAFGDVNGDGVPDLVLGVHGEPARNRLWLGEKGATVRFRDVTVEAGLPVQWPTKAPHVEIQDFDNDGWPDLYFSTGWLGTDGIITPLIYRNLGCDPGGVPQFASPTAPPEAKEVYFPAGPSADYDGDGRIDLLLVNWFEGNHTRLLRNTSKGGNWLRIRVTSKGRSNRDGLGAEVRLSTGAVREIATGYGYASGQIPVAHFGLGDRQTVGEVTVSGWGMEVTRKDVAANQVLTIALP